MLNFSSEAQVRTALDYASGAADRNGETIDTAGFEGCAFIVKFATIAAGGVNSIKVQQGSASDASDMADLAGTAQSIAADDDNQIFIVDVVKPTERYLRIVIDKDAANACAEDAIAVLYNPHKRPTVMTLTDEVTYERHISPAEGTA